METTKKRPETERLNKKPIIVTFRKLYQHRFIFRCLVLAATLLLYFVMPESFDAITGLNFFKMFSPFHILWVIWMFDMIMQLIPSAKYWPLGSQKLFAQNYLPLKTLLNREHLAEFIKDSTKDALAVAAVWIGMMAAVGALFFTDILGHREMLLLSTVFYLCDVICVLFWCPFRVWIMKNRCCTTCRIFNWDHIMMFSPLFFVPGIYTWSLCLMSIIILVAWEVTFALHPERFWEKTNQKLICDNCTDALCGKRNCKPL